MKIILILFCFLSITGNVYAVELVCKGDQQRFEGQRPIYVDCSNKQQVIDMLGAGWRELQKKGVAAPVADVCWNAYSRAQEVARNYHPSVSFEAPARSFLIQCNTSLQQIK